MNSLVSMLMNVQRYFKLQLVWELSNKCIDILLIFIAVVFYYLFQSLVELKWQVIILVNSVEYRNSFLEFGICLIVVLKDRGKWTCCKWESHDTNEHNYDTHWSFDCILTWNISVTYGSNCTDCEIKGSKI